MVLRLLTVALPTALLLALLLLAGCADDQQREVLKQAADGKPLVVCTTGMIADAARRVGGDEIHVYAMMGPGTDPHSYQPTTGDMRALGSADLILYNGLHLEAKLGDILEKRAEQSLVVAVAEGISATKLLTDAESGYHDPHIWFDVTLWREAVGAVAEALAKASPSQAENFQQRTKLYQNKLSELEQYIDNKLVRIPAEQRVLVTAHDAFGYFGAAYGFEVVGLQGISTEAEAGIADVRSLAELISERRIRAMFVESSVPVKQVEAVQAAVQARGWEVEIGGELFSDAMGDAGTSEESYIGMVRHNIDVIVAALADE